jgi:putative nucleotidyltransferase with HDIG domain
MTREQDMALLLEYTRGESLIRHMLAVEAAMRAYAARLGQDVELWGTVGLLHDFDYEAFPDPAVHTVRGGEILAERGYPREVIRAIQTHNPKNGLNLPRESALEKCLMACDELCGFITAVALVRPSRSLSDLTAGSVVKKMKDRAFARQVSREEIRNGTAEFGVPLNEHVDFVIMAMRNIAGEIGLDGSLARRTGAETEEATS